MLRIGLTGELGSGKSAVARLLAQHGAIVLSSDEMGRAMMQPGEPVYRAILERFGPGIVAADGSLDRRELARLAFDPAQPRVEELNRIVHPAVLEAQERAIAEIAREQPRALVAVESALILTKVHEVGEQPWRKRFDCVVLVTAPDALKVKRFVERMRAGRTLCETESAALRDDAERRLAMQRIPAELAAGCLAVENRGDLAALEQRVDGLFAELMQLRDAMDR